MSWFQNSERDDYPVKVFLRVCVCGRSWRIKMLLTGVAPIGCCRRDSNANRLPLLVQLQLSWRGGGGGQKGGGGGCEGGPKSGGAVSFRLSCASPLCLDPPVSDRKLFQVTSPLTGNGGIKNQLISHDDHVIASCTGAGGPSASPP